MGRPLCVHCTTGPHGPDLPTDIRPPSVRDFLWAQEVRPRRPFVRTVLARQPSPPLAVDLSSRPPGPDVSHAAARHQLRSATNLTTPPPLQACSLSDDLPLSESSSFLSMADMMNHLFHRPVRARVSPTTPRGAIGGLVWSEIVRDHTQRTLAFTCAYHRRLPPPRPAPCSRSSAPGRFSKPPPGPDVSHAAARHQLRSATNLTTPPPLQACSLSADLPLSDVVPASACAFCAALLAHVHQ